METELLVIGAGPYALSTAALARERGIDTVIAGRPMDFWRKHMPEGMFLRSGPDWHLDAAHHHTLEAFLEERGLSHEEVDPLPIAVFLSYTEWFIRTKRLEIREELIETLVKRDGGFEATFEGGERLVARSVVAAPGVSHYRHIPEWAAAVPLAYAAHTCDLVELAELADKRVLIVGGRQSAYEWAALAAEHGAARIDIAHRHEIPRFEHVSWKFADPHVDRTVAVRGYWRHLPQHERDAIARRFWEVGRLTLEYWLTPRLERKEITRWPCVQVVEIAAKPGTEALSVLLSNGARLVIDRVVFACGYRADLAKVPYLAKLIDLIAVRDGFPALDESFQTSVEGLYITGFSATNDFGPFFGFVKGVPAAATLIVRDLLEKR